MGLHFKFPSETEENCRKKMYCDARFLGYASRFMSSTEQGQPARRLNLLHATSVNMANMIGTGIFVTAPPILASMGWPDSVLGFLAGAIIAICDGLVVSELGAAMPDAGGSYVFLRESYGRERWGRLMAWLFVWQFLFSGTLEIASGCIGMAQYMGFFWPELPLHPIWTKLVASSIAAILIVALYRKIDDVAKLTVVLWSVVLVTVGGVMLTGLLKGSAAMAFPAWHTPTLGWSFFAGLGACTVLVLYDYFGYDQICYLGGEVQRPERTIPRSVILSVIIVTGIFLAVTASLAAVLPWKEMAREGSPAYQAAASVFMEKSFGTGAAQVCTVLILFTAFASVFALLLGYSRIPYAAALDGEFFPWFAKLHPKHGFPHRSLLLVGLVSLVACFFGLVDIISALISARILVLFVARIFGLFALRRRLGPNAFPFRMWLFPVPAIIALFGWLLVFVSPVLTPGGGKFLVYAALTILTGIVGFFVLARRARNWPFQA